MGRREDNALIFEDTTAFVNENEKLKEAVKRTMDAQKLYLADYSIPEPVKRYIMRHKLKKIMSHS